MTAPKTCPCPHCGGVGLWMPAIYDAAYVDYYQCFSCANVWTVPKDRPESSHVPYPRDARSKIA